MDELLLAIMELPEREKDLLLSNLKVSEIYGLMLDDEGVLDQWCAVAEKVSEIYGKLPIILRELSNRYQV